MCPGLCHPSHHRLPMLWLFITDSVPAVPYPWKLPFTPQSQPGSRCSRCHRVNTVCEGTRRLDGRHGVYLSPQPSGRGVPFCFSVSPEGSDSHRCAPQPLSPFPRACPGQGCRALSSGRSGPAPPSALSPRPPSAAAPGAALLPRPGGAPRAGEPVRGGVAPPQRPRRK